MAFLLVLSLQTIPSVFALLIPTQFPTRFGNGQLFKRLFTATCSGSTKTIWSTYFEEKYPAFFPSSIKCYNRLQNSWHTLQNFGIFLMNFALQLKKYTVWYTVCQIGWLENSPKTVKCVISFATDCRHKHEVESGWREQGEQKLWHKAVQSDKWTSSEIAQS